MNDDEARDIQRRMVQVNDDLRRALIPPPDTEDAEATLANQMKALDLAFRDTLDDYLSVHGMRGDLSNALRAQNQYRSTLKLRDAIKQKNEKRTNGCD